MNLTVIKRRAVIGLIGLFLTSLAHAQTPYPERPIKLIVPFPAGGSIDTIARLLAEEMQTDLKVPIIVDNKPGATGLIGTQSVVRAPADGYSVLMTTSAITIAPWLTQTNFKPDQLTAVTEVAKTPYVLVVGKNREFTTIDQFIDYAKHNPNKLTCSTYGVGSPPHIALELFKKSAGVQIVHVPYKGFTQALPDLASGRIDCSVHTEVDVEPHIRKGTLRALANTSDAPMPILKETVPLAIKWPETKIEGWQGIFVPAGTPGAVLQKLHHTFTAIIKRPQMVEHLRTLGFIAVANSQSDFEKQYLDEYHRYGPVLKSINTGN